MNGKFVKVFSLFLDLHFKFSKFLTLEMYFYRQFAPNNTEIETKADKQTAKSEFLRVLHLAFIYMVTNYQRAVMSNYSLFLKRGGIIMRHK